MSLLILIDGEATVVTPAALTRLIRRALRSELASLKEQLMTDQADVLAQLDEIKTLATETKKDVLRVAQALDDAVKANDLGAIAASAAELRSIVQGTDDAAEAASPEPVETPPAGDNEGDGSTDAPTSGE
jgi:hypothetical protein